MSVSIGEVGRDRVRNRIPQRDCYAFDIDPTIKEVGVHQIGIKRILLGMLPESAESPVVLGLNLTDPEADLIGITLVSFVGMARGCCALVSIQVNGKIAEDSHRYLPNLPPELRRHLEYQKIVHSGLVRHDGRCTSPKCRIADECRVKCVARS